MRNKLSNEINHAYKGRDKENVKDTDNGKKREKYEMEIAKKG